MSTYTRPVLAILVGFSLLCVVPDVASARMLPFEASLRIEVGNLGALEGAGVSGSLHAQVTGGSHVIDFSVPAGEIRLTNAVSVSCVGHFCPEVPQVRTLRATLNNGPGSFVGSFQPGRRGLMGLVGALELVVGRPSAEPLGTILLPLTGAFGQPGTRETTWDVLQLPFVIRGAAWTTGTAVAVTGTGGTTVTRMGGLETFWTLGGETIHDPVRSAYKHQVFTWVTPTQISVVGAVDLAAFGTFEIEILHHVPEPGMLLLGAGVAGWIYRRWRLA